MGRLPNLLRLGSKLVLEILPSIAATVIGGYLLTQLHFSRTPEAPPAAAVAAAVPETPTVGEERAAIRDVLKARRENPQAPEVVRPKPATPPATASVPASPPPAAAESASPVEPVERTPSRPNLAVAAAPPARRDLDVPRPRPEGAASVYVPAPPPGVAVAPAVPAAAPAVTAAASEPPAQPLSPVVVSAPPATAQMAPPPVERGPVGTVLSGISVLVGQAANVTGHTVNWVIDLPGKAIEAGGRAIGVSPPPPPPSRPFS